MPVSLIVFHRFFLGDPTEERLLASKLSLSPEQLVYADRLLSSLQSIVSRQVAREMDGLAPLSPEEDIPEFLGVVARDAYKRAHREANWMTLDLNITLDLLTGKL